jgi:glycosyltransferase involved in cell wall biosynthesis
MCVVIIFMNEKNEIIQSNIKVSIIITCYNYGRFLDTSINSSLCQTHPNIEVIVVNDGSTDNTVDVIKTYGNKIKFINQSNKGVSSARNNGILNSNGEWILPLDADDWISPNYISDSINLICNYKTVIFSRYYFVDTNLKSLNKHYPSIDKTEKEILESCTLKNMVLENSITNTALYSKKMWKICGGYNEYFQIGEDWEFYINMLSNGANVKFMCQNEPYLLYRIHGDNNSLININEMKKKEKMLEQTKRYINRKYKNK